MISENEDWTPPPFGASVRNPEIRAAWAARVAEWCRQNPELASAWNEAVIEDEARTRKGWAKQEQINRLRASGVSARARDAWSAGLTDSPAVSAIRTFVGSGKTFLLLMGSPGAGKTVACTEVLANGGAFFRAIELARLSSFAAEDKRQLAVAQGCSALVLDDLGAEMLHDGWKPMLDELIDIRWGERRRTIITTNLDSPTFKSRYGERIVDRIRDDGFVVKCGDQSRRGKS
jgi:DNA replication protein DnaC